MSHPTPRFARYISIDYSGAQTAESSLKGLRVYQARGDAEPVEVQPPPSPRRYWTRRGLAHWLAETLANGPPTLVGVEHAFSCPIRYFDQHLIAHNWDAFLDDFQLHWPTEGRNTRVESVRIGQVGCAAARGGETCWRRLSPASQQGSRPAVTQRVAAVSASLRK